MVTEAEVKTAIDRKNLSGPALRSFFRIADLWDLSVSEQMILLGISARSAFYKWKKHTESALPKDALERISCILGIYKNLQILLPDTTAADNWIRKPNAAPLFGGKAPLDRADLYLVRQYLDADCGDLEQRLCRV